MEQPDSSVFYKSFLELDCSNMVSILSFDSRSMKELLSDKNAKYFQKEFPIFYKNKILKSNNNKKYFYRSPIDNALLNNQIGAIEHMIRYITRYQDTYVSSYLFQRNLNQLLEIGISLTTLLNSNIFSFNYEVDEWPNQHWENSRRIMPYNGSIFTLRNNYNSVFTDPALQVRIVDGEFKLAPRSNEFQDSRKVFKVSYHINLLPRIGQHFSRDLESGLL